MSRGVESTDRREFLKKAGTAAWIVPAIHVVNVTSAVAQTNGSVVETNPPRPSTTSANTCRCAMTLTDQEFTDGYGRFFFRIDLSDGCGDAPEYTRFEFPGVPVHEAPYTADWLFSVRFDLLPATLAATILDGNRRPLASCRLAVPAPPGDQLREAPPDAAGRDASFRPNR